MLRTLSKIGLAGLRVGFMVADSRITDEVNKVRLPFKLNSLSQNVAIDSLKNKKQMRASIRSIINERKRLFREMTKLNSIEPYPSDANFILFKTENAEKVFKGLLKRGILIRNMAGAVEGCLRVTVGTPRENSAFLKTLKQLL